MARLRPNYNGIEIDMLSLGDADCILVSRWQAGQVMRVLIDGGERQHTARVKRFLRKRGPLFLDHLVCSHLHTDHAAGLIGLVSDPEIEVGCGWVHKAAENIDEGTVQVLEEALAEGTGGEGARFLLESLRTQQGLVDALEARGFDVEQPFAGRAIGFLTVRSPTRDYYRRMLRRFRDYNQLLLLERQLSPARQVIDELIDEDRGLPERPVTSAENEAATVLSGDYGGDTYLFTSDVGADALSRVAVPSLADCDWMQVPHDGSRNNITRGLIGHFRPRVAFLSAGGVGHPHASVVDAFRGVGTRVFETHLSGDLWYKAGAVPPRVVTRRVRPM